MVAFQYAGLPTFFKKEPHLVSTCQEVIITDVLLSFCFSSGKACHGMVIQREFVQQLVRFREQLAYSVLVESIRDDEVAIVLEGGDLLSREPFDLGLCCDGAHFCRVAWGVARDVGIDRGAVGVYK